MAEDGALVLCLFLGLAGAVLADALAQPRARPAWSLRSPAGMAVALAAALALLGLMLAVTGAAMVSAVTVAALAAALALISNVKRRVLGEPLVFSDFALIAAVFQQPQFYLAALRTWQIVALIAGAAGVAGLLAWFAAPGLGPRLVGLALLSTGLAGLAGLLRLRRWEALARSPDPDADVASHGLFATLLVHWSRWRRLADPPACAAPPIPGRDDQLVVIIQCESFTDPAALLGDPSLALPGLAAARRIAARHGRLMVPGFGAYTMRTEYGVLFGRDEEALGLRRFDPFLTAQGEASFALPNRLDPDTWTCIFVHPHDLRFYRRDALMPAAGFTRLVGEDDCAPPGPGEGRYVTDAAVGDTILALAREAVGATLIYAVTIENHGPWPAAAGAAGASPAAPYLALLAHSDALLARLMAELPQLARPVTLCFFGDHRPSIPGASEPGRERHTPYVLVRFGADGRPLAAPPQAGDLTPAELHHAILAAIRSGEAQA